MLSAEMFSSHVRQQHLFQPADHLLIAVSGGVDSVALCELCHREKYTFSIAHANFGLRGDESEADEQFVRALAAHYQVPVHVRLFETEKYAAEKKISVQVAARELRYAWFNELLHAGHRWLLTAHHADDNIETMMMNFFRGTGISGLKGMLPKSNDIVRPLLTFTKEEIVAFAEENHLSWREDSSNSSDKYSRNYFRHHLLPVIRNIYPEAEQNLRRNVIRFREAGELYEQAIGSYKKKLLEPKGGEVHIPILKLKKSSPLKTIIHEIIRPYHFTSRQADEVEALLDAEHGKYILSPTHRIIKNRNWLIIAENRPERGELFIIDEGQTDAGNGLLRVGATQKIEKISADPFAAHIDAREVRFPLIFRKWKKGDYFYPLGMKKKKKVARFLIDLKLSPTQKQNIFVLESDKRICWVAGLRIDDRFKVSSKTKNILELRFDPQLLK